MSKEINDYYDNIAENEIRILSSRLAPPMSTPMGDTPSSPEENQEQPKGKTPKRLKLKWVMIGIAIAVLVMAIGYLALSSRQTEAVDEQDDMHESYETVDLDTLESNTVEEKAYVDVRVDSVNDILLKIFTPKGCAPVLHVGKLPEGDKEFVLAVQAADVRGDNGDISGAFVYQGDLLSKGQPKLGFCAIVGNEITLGRQAETPLFERAIEENGYFFRQYSLVNEGKMLEIKPKGKALRRALCYYNGEIVVIETMERESFHDFTQALADLKVDEAIALVGGGGRKQFITEDGEVTVEGVLAEEKYKNINFIVWKKKQ